jgi:hypothetical protein
MKNLYNITKGQLITIWVFGVLGTLYAIEAASYSQSDFAEFSVLLIPFILIFYTIGWRNNRKNKTK